MSLAKTTFGENLTGYTGGDKGDPAVIVLQVFPYRKPSFHSFEHSTRGQAYVFAGVSTCVCARDGFKR